MRLGPVILLVLLGCSSAGTRQPDAAKPLPDANRAAIVRAETIGRALHRIDAAAARGTDAVLAAFPQLPQDVIGWVAQPRGEDRFDVTFVAGAPESAQALYVVHVTPTAADVETIDPPRPLDAEGAAMFRARALVKGSAAELAAKAGSTRCPLPYNTAVLPASLLGEEGWLVYLLAATPDANKRVLAGHLRARVSPDGATVLDVTALSKGCLIVDASGAEVASEEGLYVTHLLDPTPIETHVFTNLLYRLPLYVGAGGTAWVVQDGKVIKLSSKLLD